MTSRDSVCSVCDMQSLLAAYVSVRARAQSLCRQLGVADVTAAVNRFCEVGTNKTLSVLVHPSGVRKSGASGM